MFTIMLCSCSKMNESRRNQTMQSLPFEKRRKFQSIHQTIILTYLRLILYLLLLNAHMGSRLVAAASSSRLSYFPSGSNAILSSQQQYFNKNVYTFIHRAAHIDTKPKCDTQLIQSDVQARMRNLKSVLSTCNGGYCRLAMSQSGLPYASKDFSLDAIWSKVDISIDELMHSPFLIGAFYMKFVLANKFLCISRSGELFSSFDQVKGCLWFNQKPRLISASFQNVNLVIKKNCKLDVETTVSSDLNNNHRILTIKQVEEALYPRDEYAQDTESTCSSSLEITSGYSSELQAFFRSCQSHLVKQSSSVAKSKPVIDVYLVGAVVNKNHQQQQQKTVEFSENDNSQAAATPKKPIMHTLEVTEGSANKQLESKPASTQNRQQSSNANDSSSIKKCYQYRSTANYSQCMRKHYPCAQYSNDPDKLKLCRKKLGVSIPQKSASKKRLIL